VQINDQRRAQREKRSVNEKQSNVRSTHIELATQPSTYPKRLTFKEIRDCLDHVLSVLQLRHQITQMIPYSKVN
jgi:hypothetical protein